MNKIRRCGMIVSETVIYNSLMTLILATKGQHRLLQLSGLKQV